MVLSPNRASRSNRSLNSVVETLMATARSSLGSRARHTLAYAAGAGGHGVEQRARPRLQLAAGMRLREVPAMLLGGGPRGSEAAAHDGPRRSAGWLAVHRGGTARRHGRRIARDLTHAHIQRQGMRHDIRCRVPNRRLDFCRPWPESPPLFRRRQVNIHGLNPNSSRTGKAVTHDLRGAGKQPGREFLKLRFHPDRTVFVDPAAGLNINLFAGSQRHLENVPVSVHPHNAFVALHGKMVNEKPSPAHQHIGNAFYPREGVFDAAGGGEKLVFPHLDSFAAVQMDSENVSRAIAAESDLPRTAGFGHQDGHSRHHAPETAFQGLDADLRSGLLPKKNMVLEVHGDTPQLDTQYGNEFALDVIGHACKLFITRYGRLQNRNRHWLLLSGTRLTATIIMDRKDPKLQWRPQRFVPPIAHAPAADSVRSFAHAPDIRSGCSQGMDCRALFPYSLWRLDSSPAPESVKVGGRMRRESGPIPGPAVYSVQLERVQAAQPSSGTRKRKEGFDAEIPSRSDLHSRGVQGAGQDKPSGRKAAVAQAVKKLGGKLDAIYFCLGENDVILIVDLPDHVSAAAPGCSACASGMARTKTTALLTVDEADEALSKPVSYRAPGA